VTLVATAPVATALVATALVATAPVATAPVAMGPAGRLAGPVVQGPVAQQQAAVARVVAARAAQPAEPVGQTEQTPTLSPSDVAEATDGEALLVGGRIRRHSERLWLCDAWASLEVELDAPLAELADGTLVRCRGTWERNALRRAELVSLTPGRANREVARFTQGMGHALQMRNHALRTVRSLFHARGFIEVETPTIVPCPGLDSHLDAFGVGDTTDEPRFLATSPEYQMKRLLVAGIPRCFQLGRAYRQGEVGQRHNPEFSMLEWYRAFGSMEEVMTDTEAVVRAVVNASARPDASIRAHVAKPFLRMTVTEAFKRFCNVDEPEMLALAEHDEDNFFHKLAFEIEPHFATLEQPLFLLRYPRPMASLAALDKEDPRYANRFELYVRGVELCNGFDELTDPAEQRRRFENDQAQRTAAKRPVYPLDHRFLAALEEGMPPSAGNALGFDRLLMLALEQPSLDHVLAFPESEL
jgi:lysyl-tRNA synthetase class 2